MYRKEHERGEKEKCECFGGKAKRKRPLVKTKYRWGGLWKIILLK
jgi:hypothetical protein